MENIKKEFQQLLDETRETVKAEIKNAFLQGADAGALSVCRTLYETFTIAGLEPTNVLFDMLKDIAKNHKCDDLEEYCRQRREESSGNALN